MLNQMIITSVEDVFTVDSPKGRRFTMVNRNSFGITFCYSGQISYFHRSNTVISDRNHMVLLPQGETYSLRGDASGRFPVINVRCTSTFPLKEPTAFSLARPEVYLKRYEQLKDLFILGKHSAKCLSILYDMLSDIITENTGGNRICSAAVAYIGQHYTDPTLNIAAIAAKLGISEVYLRRLFQKEFSATPKQYVMDLRIRKAKQLLSEGHLPIQAIAETCGYSGIYHFSRAFHQSTGLSPSAYRNQERRLII